MNPMLLLYGLITFGICLCIHILLWRLKRPSNDASKLFIIFIIIPVILTVFLLALPDNSPARMSLSPLDIIAVLFLHVALSAAYIASYPAAQASSPSLEIILVVASVMPEGAKREDLIKYFDDKKLVSNRFEDLVNLKLATEKDGVFVMTPAAKIITGFFVLFRKMLGLRTGGG